MLIIIILSVMCSPYSTCDIKIKYRISKTDFSFSNVRLYVEVSACALHGNQTITTS